MTGQVNKIYIKEEEVPVTKTRKALIKLFLRGKYMTYSDKECTVAQCKIGAYRSITDLHQIALTRFPITSFKAILRIVIECMKEDKSVSLIYCTQIQKVVLSYNYSLGGAWATEYSIKNFFKTKGVDGYSLEDYQKIIDEFKII